MDIGSKIEDFFTRDNITLLLAILGSIGTVFGFFYNCILNRKNLRIHIPSIEYHSAENEFIIAISFENRSRLPIAVTNVSLIIDGQPPYEPEEYPEAVNEYKEKINGEEAVREIKYNLDLPIDIQPLGASSGYVLFDIAPITLENITSPLLFEVASTRGSSQKINIPLSQIKK